MKRRSFLKGVLATPLMALPIAALAKVLPKSKEATLAEVARQHTANYLPVSGLTTYAPDNELRQAFWPEDKWYRQNV